MAWSESFSCPTPDFRVRSAQDGTIFAVQRAALQNSEVFRDMFSCCEQASGGPDSGTPAEPADPASSEILDLHEPSGTLVSLLRLLHTPPPPPTVHPAPEPDMISPHKIPVYDPHTLIPLPLLPPLLALVDKYILPAVTQDTLAMHLAAHAPAHALRVYGLACAGGLHAVARDASPHVAPLDTYPRGEVVEALAAAGVGAYHDLVRLQAFRVRTLRRVLLSEDVFPFGYGECAAHKSATRALWETKRSAVAALMTTGTDVAGEMDAVTEAMKGCAVCAKACTAAVGMLAYKCRKVPRKIHQVPEDDGTQT